MSGWLHSRPYFTGACFRSRLGPAINWKNPAPYRQQMPSPYRSDHLVPCVWFEIDRLAVLSVWKNEAGACIDFHGSRIPIRNLHGVDDAEESVLTRKVTGEVFAKRWRPSPLSGLHVLHCAGSWNTNRKIAMHCRVFSCWLNFARCLESRFCRKAVHVVGAWLAGINSIAPVVASIAE